MRVFVVIWMILIPFAAGCSSWDVESIPNNAPQTTIPSKTPLILSATPNIRFPTVTGTISESTLTPTASIETATFTPVSTTTVTPSGPTSIPTISTIPSDPLKIEILGCNTSLDISHGMGEVTNAYITMNNLGPTDLDQTCATLRGADEGRPHPDKTRCVSSLPAGFGVTLKLTIDTTYREDSPVQIEVTSNNVLLQRLAQSSCSNIGILPPDYDDLGVVKRIP